MWAPQFKLRSFQTLSDAAKGTLLVQLLDALTAINVAWLRENPGAPWLYESGVRYEDEPFGRDDWQDIPETLVLGNGDCEDLGCWRLAELQFRLKEPVRPYVTARRIGHFTVWHVDVLRADGTIENPSRALGMRD